MRKAFLVLLLIIILSLLTYSFSGKTEETNKTQVTPAVVKEVSFGMPQILSVNKLSVETEVESVGMDSKGRMDVPKKVENVAWYNLGAKPGQMGSAVFAGHFDDPKGDPAVFYNLDSLEKGDEIIVTDENGKELTYIVDKKATYDSNNFPLQEVFANSSYKRLNLITCNGTWDIDTKNYSKRLVVFSVLKE